MSKLNAQIIIRLSFLAVFLALALWAIRIGGVVVPWRIICVGIAFGMLSQLFAKPVLSRFDL